MTAKIISLIGEGGVYCREVQALAIMPRQRSLSRAYRSSPGSASPFYTLLVVALHTLNVQHVTLNKLILRTDEFSILRKLRVLGLNEIGELHRGEPATSKPNREKGWDDG